jgi:hypothetical protein
MAEHAGVRDWRAPGAVRTALKKRSATVGIVVRAADHEAEALLVVLGERVDRAEGGALVSGVGRGLSSEAVVVAHLPVGTAELVERALHRGGSTLTGRALVEPLAVEAHARGDDEPLDRARDERPRGARRCRGC